MSWSYHNSATLGTVGGSGPGITNIEYNVMTGSDRLLVVRSGDRWLRRSDFNSYSERKRSRFRVDVYFLNYG